MFLRRRCVTGALRSRHWPREAFGGIRDALQLRFPTSDWPDVWRRNIGRLTVKGWPVVGSVCVVSPLAISTQPRRSSPLVKKSPRRRSFASATHVVPPWHTELFTWIGRRAVLVRVKRGFAAVALKLRASKIRMFAVWQ